MVHLYVKVPAVVNLNGNDPPGLRIPEFHIPPSATESCAIVSLLVHVTVVPTATVSGFVPNAVVVSVRALFGIDTAAVGPLVVVVVEDELGEDEELPQAAAAAATTAAITTLRKDIRLLNGCACLSARRTPSRKSIARFCV
jgi:hypothetical protein